MPIYAYHCATCDSDVEVLVKLSETQAPACPNCGATDLKRLVSRVAPPAKSPGLIAGARKQAAREGHFSNYSKAERAKL